MRLTPRLARVILSPGSAGAKNLSPCLTTALLLGILLTVPAASAQTSQALMPEESAAKAKQLIQRAITVLGGPAYLGIKDVVCTGRLAQFGSQGDLTGYIRFRDLTILPDKNRTEYGTKNNLIDIYNGNQGWTLDRGGVSDIPVGRIEDFQRSLKEDVDNLLRTRLNEEGLVFRYAGRDLVDLKPVEWVEIVDRERRTFRIAFELSTGLPIRTIVVTRDPETRERTERVTLFSNYQPQNGVQTPMQIARETNGRRIFQVFFADCQYNTNLAPDLFTRASLDQRWAQLDKKKK